MTTVTVVDYLGFEWKCQFHFIQQHRTLCCRLGGEWGMLCKVRKFVEGQKLVLAVVKKKENDVIHLRYVPLPSTSRRLPADFDPNFFLQTDAAVFNLKGIF